MGDVLLYKPKPLWEKSIKCSNLDCTGVASGVSCRSAPDAASVGWVRVGSKAQTSSPHTKPARSSHTLPVGLYAAQAGITRAPVSPSTCLILSCAFQHAPCGSPLFFPFLLSHRIAAMSPILLPRGNATCTVRVIDSTSTIHYPAKYFFEKSIEGYDDLACPAYSFLLTDATGKRHILFDLGVRKDWREAFPHHFLQTLESKGARNDVEKDVFDLLQEGHEADPSLPSPNDIESIVWSHHHFDHTGNPNRFSSNVSLVVGPGFKQAILPGHPADPKSSVVSAMWEDRELVELDLQKKALQIGRFQAYDFFNDGSLYLLHTPGHAPGHLSALVRVTPDTFVVLGGDAAHHAGELRPTQYLPLPEHVALPSSQRYRTAPGCPCEVLERLGSGSRTQPFLKPSDDFCQNREDALSTIDGLGELDGSDAVFVILAHDKLLRGIVPLYPRSINDWQQADLDRKTRWLFVDDFAVAADKL